MSSVRSSVPGFFHEMQNTVWPRSTRYLTSELCGERSRM